MKLRPLSGRSTILPGIDDGAHAGRFGLQDRGRCVTFDRLADVAHFELDIEAGDLFHL